MGEPIRVAHVVGKMVGGGLEAVVMNYYRHIDRSRVQFDLLVDSDSTLVPRDEVEFLGGRVIEVPPYQDIVASQRELLRLFRREHWPIVHSHMNALSVFPLHAACKAGVPVRIAHSHSTSGGGEYIRNAMKAVLKTQANLYPTHRFACSRHAGEWLFGKNADFEVVYNAIELDRFRFDSEARREARRVLGIPDSRFVIGNVGRFMPQKNQAFLVEAFGLACSERVDVALVLVGEGPMRGEVERLAASKGLADRVFFLGQRDDMERLYSAFDAFALPSLYEGLGIVAIEAQRAGVPCLLSDRVPGEVNVTGECRFLPIDDPKAWSDAIHSMAEKPSEQRSAIDDSCFALYDIDSAAGLLARRYESLLEEAGKWSGA